MTTNTGLTFTNQIGRCLKDAGGNRWSFCAAPKLLPTGRGQKNWLAVIASTDAHTGALFGDCRTAKARAAQVSANSGSRELADAAFTLAICGEDRQAQKIADELAARFPKDTVLHGIRLPTVYAALELQRGHADQAIELLESTRRYEGVQVYFVTYLRGLAFLKKGAGAEAAAEFQKIQDNPGWYFWSPLLPLSHLWEARAAALAGDTPQSRKSYQEFFALWKDADADLPILIEAKKEYERSQNRLR